MTDAVPSEGEHAAPERARIAWLAGVALLALLLIAGGFVLIRNDATEEASPPTTLSPADQMLFECHNEMSEVVNTLVNTGDTRVLGLWGSQDPRTTAALSITSEFIGNRAKYGVDTATDVANEAILNACTNYLASPTTTVAVKPAITVTQPTTTRSPPTTRDSSTTADDADPESGRVVGPTVDLQGIPTRLTATGMGSSGTSILDMGNVIVIEERRGDEWSEVATLHTDIAVGVGPEGIVAEDVTGDGNVDFVVAFISNHSTSAAVTADGGGWRLATFVAAYGETTTPGYLSSDSQGLFSMTKTCDPACYNGVTERTDWKFNPGTAKFVEAE